MDAKISTTTGRCPFCPAKGKEQPLFVIKSANFTGKLCGEHFYSLADQEKQEQAAPPNGQSAVQEVG